MTDLMTVSPSPHIRSGRRTTHIMLDVCIALLPSLVVACFVFGMRAFLVTVVCVVVCIVSELVFELVTKRPVTVSDLSAVVTGLLIGFNLPVDIPLWQAVVGCVVAIVIVKQLFGGIGCNFANPAITARIVMTIAFTDTMTAFTHNVDAVSGATPLASGTADYVDLFLGRCGGVLGETCKAALILGGLYLIVRRVITWHIPVAYIGTVFIFSWLVGEDPVYQILSGGLMLGAVFMATDYSTSPNNSWGKIIFGIGCGLITAVIRHFGSYHEGVSFAVLLMNIICPYIDRWTAKRPLGGVKEK